MVRTSRTTGGTSTPPRRRPGCSGATTTHKREFPYADLRDTNRGRSRLEPEYELVDTGIFADDRYWVVTGTWAKAGAEDLLWRLEVRNVGPEEATLDVLPTIWFRNRWSWVPGSVKPRLSLRPPATILVEDAHLGLWTLRGDGSPTPLFCDNDTNTRKLYGVDGPAYPKDGIDDHVVAGAASVNPVQTGTKAALRYRLTVGPGQVAEIRLRFSRVEAGGVVGGAVGAADGAGAPGAVADEIGPTGPADLGAGFERILGDRAGEADLFYAGITPADATPEEARVLRQAAAGMLWSKQFFHYDVARLAGGRPGPAGPPARPGRHPQRGMDAPQQPGRDLDAGPLGVSLVRGLGSGLPLRRPRPPRRRVRQGAAAAALPRVVHAPQRAAPRLRVELQRRQPPGPRLGGAARLRDRLEGEGRPRRRRHSRRRFHRAGLPQVAAQLHVVGEPQGRGRQQRVPGRVPRPRQHRAVRPVQAPTGRRHASSSPTARHGWRCTASVCSRWR